MNQTHYFKKLAYRFKRFARKSYSAFNSMHKEVNIGVLSGCMLTLVHFTGASAQNPAATPKDSIREQDMEEVLVTAAKAELTLKQAAKLVTLISQKEISQQPSQSIPDLLKSVAGVDVRQRGGNGVQSDISVRGCTFDQIAILLNGTNLTNPQTGHYSLDLPVNLSDIERIEIIQGPSSLLYGVSAFSGGVNIITKKQESGNQAYANLKGGMYELFGAEAGGALRMKNSSHHLSGGYNSSGGYIGNTDYKIFNTLWQSHFQSNESKLDLQAGFLDKKYGANSFYSAAHPNQFDDTQSLFASIRGETGHQLKIVPQLYWNRFWDCFQLYRDGTPDIPPGYSGHNYHRSDVYGLNLNMQYKWKAGITGFGGELRHESILSNKLGHEMESPDGKYTKSDSRSNISYFFEHSFLWGKTTLSAGLLANQNTFLNNQPDFFPNISAAHWLTDHLKLYASWNNAMRMPTFTDLYYTTSTHTGNQDLKPEKSESYELGVKYHHPILSGYLTGFYMKGQNIIDWVKENPESLWESRNITQLDKTGLETGLSLCIYEIFPRMQSTILSIGYMYLNQTRNSENLISNYALDYLKHKFTASLNFPIYKNLSADCQFRWQNREGSYIKYENLKKASEVEYPPYSVVDLKISWKMEKFHIYATANNLFDTFYYDLGNIPQPGFWFSGGISYSLQ